MISFYEITYEESNEGAEVAVISGPTGDHEFTFDKNHRLLADRIRIKALLNAAYKAGLRDAISQTHTAAGR